jgi:hypothetical protein
MPYREKHRRVFDPRLHAICRVQAKRHNRLAKTRDATGNVEIDGSDINTPAVNSKKRMCAAALFGVPFSFWHAEWSERVC